MVVVTAPSSYGRAAWQAAAVRRVAVISSASGNGKSTLARAVARRLDVPYVELDAIHHGPGWAELSAEELQSRVAPILATDAWVIDGTYRRKLGDLVLRHADTVVWLDQPICVWLPRLLRRTIGRIVRREELWNGNRETWRGAFGGRDALVWWALRGHRRHRREWPSQLAPFAVVRLQSQREIEAWLASLDGDEFSTPAPSHP